MDMFGLIRYPLVYWRGWHVLGMRKESNFFSFLEDR